MAEIQAAGGSDAGSRHSPEKLAIIRQLNVDPVRLVLLGTCVHRGLAVAGRSVARAQPATPRTQQHAAATHAPVPPPQANPRFMLLVEDALRPESLPRGWSAHFDAAAGTWCVCWGRGPGGTRCPVASLA
jgi:hypothetical protein